MFSNSEILGIKKVCSSILFRAIINKNNLGDIGFDSGNDLVYDLNGRLIVVGSIENILGGTLKRESNKNIFVATWH